MAGLVEEVVLGAAATSLHRLLERRADRLVECAASLLGGVHCHAPVYSLVKNKMSCWYPLPTSG
jgi:hypothetical protein